MDQKRHPTTYLKTTFALCLILVLLLSGFVTAQVPKLNDQPILISLESYLVQERENEAGQIQEWFEKVNEAKANQTIEIRLNVRSKAETPITAGTLLITMPILEGMQYIENSATPSSDLVMLEFSSDKEEFAENLFQTVKVTTAEEETVEKRLPVPTEDYQALRWTVLNDFETDEELILFYRIQVLETYTESE